jgi:hypothetical protein
MQIDEARRDDGAVHIDGPFSWRADRGRDLDDRVAAYGKVRAVPRASRAIDYARIAQHEIVRTFGCVRGGYA